MEIEEIMNLFDSCWFEMEILKKQTSQSTSTSFEPNPDRKTEGNSSKPELKRTQNSVLQSPNLHKTISGKEIAEEELKETCSNMRFTRRKKGRRSKSLSELEFEELKGFMDLGFVFSEEDNKDSRVPDLGNEINMKDSLRWWAHTVASTVR
ncbi:hypothetical protein GOBAR_DD21690 [Gossypium barbadense]|nr:hypothetical protein GOBAR_DD21690 [Gossypium barbadense]